MKSPLGEIAACYYRASDPEGKMVTIIDVAGETEKLNMLRDRRPDMLEAERRASGAFATLTPFRDGNIFAAKFSGNGAWERHPNGEELVQIVAGETKLHIIIDDEPQTHELRAGMLVVVPQGTWHRFEAPDGVCLMTATPKPTEHLTVDVDDPRTLEAGRLAGRGGEKRGCDVFRPPPPGADAGPARTNRAGDRGRGLRLGFRHRAGRVPRPVARRRICRGRVRSSGVAGGRGGRRGAAARIAGPCPHRHRARERADRAGDAAR